jgi:hypothetical protein
MDRKRAGDQESASHLLCSSNELPTNPILGHRDKDMLPSIMFSWIGVWQINSQGLRTIVILRPVAIVSHSKQKLICTFFDQTNNFSTYRNSIFEL